MITVEVADRQKKHPIPQDALSSAVKLVLQGEGITHAEVSVAIVDDAEIHQLNRRHLSHDYATDVLSFLLDRDDDSRLEGEIVLSADTAAANSVEFQTSLDHEILLYAIHGTLHLLGWEDRFWEQQQAMRAAEACYLRKLAEAHGGAEKLRHGLLQRQEKDAP